MIERPPPTREVAPVAAPALAAPVAATHPLLQLQARAGNRATIALLRRQAEADAPPRDEELEVEDAAPDAGELVEVEGDEEGETSVDELVDVEDTDLDARFEAMPEARSDPYEVEGDDEVHTAQVRFEDGEAVPGVNSTWTTVQRLCDVLLGDEARNQGVPAIRVQTLRQPVDRAKARLDAASRELASVLERYRRMVRDARDRERDAERERRERKEGKGPREDDRARSRERDAEDRHRRDRKRSRSRSRTPKGRGAGYAGAGSTGGYGDPDRSRSPGPRGGRAGRYEASIADGARDRLKERALDAAHVQTALTRELTVEAQAFHRAVWYEWGDVLGVHLMPAAAVFQDKAEFAGGADLDDYHEGTSGDPIPIVWYKAPEDYPDVLLPPDRPRGPWQRYRMQDTFRLGGVQFGVTAPYRPRVGWQLRKVAHASDRAEQRRFNQILSANDAYIGDRPFAQAGVDGDHVMDLGFGGADHEDNYWPLPSGINRRAFNGYNGTYVVNYKEDVGGGVYEGRSRAIGGLIGKYFVVKAFLDDTDPPVPEESETVEAGTDD